MEENETPQPDYLKGFNEGYLLSKHFPEMAETISQSIGKSERGTGFIDGRKERIFELRKDNYPAWRKVPQSVKDDDSLPPDKSKELDKDIDDLEPDV